MRALRWSLLSVALVACHSVVGIQEGSLWEEPVGGAGGGASGAAGKAGGGATGQGGIAGASGAAGRGGAGGEGGAAGTTNGGQGGGQAGSTPGGAGGEAGGGLGGTAGTSGAAGAAGTSGAAGAAGTGVVIPGGAPPIGWVRRYGTPSDDTVTIGTSDGAHGVLLGGRLTSTITFAPGFVVPVKGAETRFFLRVNETGDVVWVRSFTAQTTTFYAMVALPDGGALVAATIEGKLTPGEADTFPGYVAPAIPSARAPALLRLAPDGRLRWARRFATTLGDGTSVVRTAEGVFFAGTYVGSCDLGDGKILPGTPDTVDVFVAKLDEDTGATLAGHGLVAAQATGVPLVVARANGVAALLPCASPFTVDGAGPPTPCDGLGFVPIAPADGSPLLGDTKSLTIPAAGALRAARTPAGDIYLASRFEGTTNVAGTSLASGPGPRILFVRLNDAGEAQAAVGLGGPNTHVVNALAADAVEGVLFAGSAKGSTPYEGGSVTATPAGQSNAILGRLRPGLTIAWLGLAPGAGAPLAQAANTIVSDELSIFTGASMSSTFFVDAPFTALGQRDIVLLRSLR